ncbi:hypothetical protein PoB_006428300 [Plakobranchus ocellatus]|uniref:Uncharacterized protein n=1 Tax=Plakobranchus ocellatus TaxID=259542 RepID=A0AAV4D165_9GAST|nr:hypothetical protein PoB_006428300 [Plakobranchus ocellatus]
MFNYYSKQMSYLSQGIFLGHQMKPRASRQQAVYHANSCVENERVEGTGFDHLSSADTEAEKGGNSLWVMSLLPFSRLLLFVGTGLSKIDRKK